MGEELGVDLAFLAGEVLAGEGLALALREAMGRVVAGRLAALARFLS